MLVHEPLRVTAAKNPAAGSLLCTMSSPAHKRSTDTITNDVTAKAFASDAAPRDAGRERGRATPSVGAASQETLPPRTRSGTGTGVRVMCR